MLIRTVKYTDSEVNFQTRFVCLRVVLALKMAYRLRERLLSGVFDRKVAHLP
jgi:hypothetical protein